MNFPQVCCVCSMPHILNEESLQLMKGGTAAAHKRCAATAKGAALENVQADLVAELVAGEDEQMLNILAEKVFEKLIGKMEVLMGPVPDEIKAKLEGKG